MTEMDLMRIREEFRRLVVLAGEWTPDGITALERDLALGKLRELYDTLRFIPIRESSATETPAGEEAPMHISLDEVLFAGVSVLEQEPEMPTQEPALVAEQENSVFISVEGPVEESEPIVAKDSGLMPIAPEPEVSTTEAEEPEPVSEPALVKPLELALFGAEEIEVHKHKQRVIMSLYDETPVARHPAFEIGSVKESDVQPAGVAELVKDPDVAESPASEFEPAAETEEYPEPETGSESEIIYAVPEASRPASEAGAVLGEVINRGVQTLGETLTAPRNTISEAAHIAHVDDLRTAIGINDRFLLVRDLFGGDAVACDAAIDKLNSFDDLDDCMIYIAEHYAWNPNSDGAKLLVELLERKLI